MAFVKRRLVNPPRKRRNAFTSDVRSGKVKSFRHAGGGSWRIRPSTPKAPKAGAKKRTSAAGKLLQMPLFKARKINPVITAVGNPSKRRTNLQKKHKKSAHPKRRRRNPIAAAPVVANPAPNPRRRRRNPGVGNLVKGTVGMLPQAGILIGGAVGARMLTQAVLGSKNNGILGYGVHILSTAGMAAIAAKFLGAQGAFMAGLGGTTSLLLRLIGDFTPLGARLALAGLGDYQVSTIFSPKRYIDPLRSAAVELPLALQAPAAPVATSPRPVGVGRRTLYGKRSMYS